MSLTPANSKMGRLHWAVGVSGNERRNSLGYATANVQMRAALEPHLIFDEAAPTALHFCYPDPAIFQPRAGQKQVLFTMYEHPDLSAEIRAALPQVDLVITPSRWSAEILKPAASCPVEVCPLGVDLLTFRHRPRSAAVGRPFRWLYVGAPNARKYTVLPEIFNALVKRSGNVMELYFKTTGVGVEALAELGGEGVEVEPGLWRADSLWLDVRFLSTSQLADVYAAADGFLLLHCGEGWGLTGLEAMATGLAPVITDYSGTQAYADARNSYPIPCTGRDVPLIDHRTRERRVQRLPWPDVHRTMDAMAEAILHPEARLVKGRAAARTARRFGWPQAGNRLFQILRGRGML